jgi:hypothetical protein
MVLRPILQGVLSPQPSHRDIRWAVDAILRMASVYLAARQRGGTLRLDLLGGSLHDLAIDCVAPLFERDKGGSFPQLLTYYNSVNWTMLDEAELLACTRRLVFSKVNQQLAHLYKDADPSLERILRNLRNALRRSADAREERVSGDLWISLDPDDPSRRRLPVVSLEYLEIHLIPCVQDRMSMPEVLEALLGLLRSHTSYRPAVPLTVCALAVRMAFSRLGREIPEEQTKTEEFLRPEEVRRMIDQATNKVEREKFLSYVGRGKVDSCTYSRYFSAIRDMLDAEFIQRDGHDRSFREYLAAHLPGLTDPAYRENHRCHVEYLAKLSRAAFLREIGGEL